MNAELISYMLNELSGHVERLNEMALAESSDSEPDTDTIFYHKERADKIIEAMQQSLIQVPSQVEKPYKVV